MSTYLIELQAEADASGLDVFELERLAAHALQSEEVPKPAELSILLADDAVVRELNRTYRDTDSPTDVLSFAQSEGDLFVRSDEATPHLGDVIISLDTARRQAAEYRQELQDEVAHLLVHGVLHLLGFDHEEPHDAALMREHEDAILGTPHHHEH